MYKSFLQLPIDDVIRLYRQKLGAEANKDKKTLDKMFMIYPDLFSNEFDDFITELKNVSGYLDMKYDVDYSSLFKPALLN